MDPALCSSCFPHICVSSLCPGQKLSEAQAGSQLEGRTGILIALLCSGWTARTHVLPLSEAQTLAYLEKSFCIVPSVCSVRLHGL